jgi:hypothetical protein
MSEGESGLRNLLWVALGLISGILFTMVIALIVY